MFVPVVDHHQQPLMPTTSARARRWIKSGKATPFWKGGVFCVRLNLEPSARHTQPIAVGIDPGSKKEALVVKSSAHTYINIQAGAVTWVKEAVETRYQMRRARRFRKTPCRPRRFNRAGGSLPPSTKARWQWKLRLCRWLCLLFPITNFVVEDIQAATKGKRRWDRNFSPLEVGKHWFYTELGQVTPVQTRQGWETKQLRETVGLRKSSNKLAETFSAHCVDAWVLAWAVVGGSMTPDNVRLLCVTPLRWHRRQLHRLQPGRGGLRTVYGSTRSLGFTRGTLVQHPRYGVVYVGGTLHGRLSLHQVADGKRFCRTAQPADCRTRVILRWRVRLLPTP
jgi:RRXRR protein